MSDHPRVYEFETIEDFEYISSNFSAFIAHIESVGEAHKPGICKLIPPNGWVPKELIRKKLNASKVLIEPVQQTRIEVEPGFYYSKLQTGESIELRKFFNKSEFKEIPVKKLANFEKKFWTPGFEQVEYGTDKDISFIGKSIDIFNAKKCATLLSDVKHPMRGVKTPYSYFGKKGSYFAWHVEDMDLYAINIQYFGAPKQWYSIPPEEGYKLEQLGKEFYPLDYQKCFQDEDIYCENPFRHKKFTISPEILKEKDIKCQKLIQYEGQIIIVFPYAYHR